jgi:hypothetical protein
MKVAEAGGRTTAEKTYPWFHFTRIELESAFELGNTLSLYVAFHIHE